MAKNRKASKKLVDPRTLIVNPTGKYDGLARMLTDFPDGKASKALIHKAGAFALTADDAGDVGVFGERLRPKGTPPTNTPGERVEYITPPSN